MPSQQPEEQIRRRWTANRGSKSELTKPTSLSVLDQQNRTPGKADGLLPLLLETRAWRYMCSIIVLATFTVGLLLLPRPMTPGSVRLASLLSEDAIAGTLQLGLPWTPRQRRILGQQGPYTPSFLNNSTLPPIWLPKPSIERDEVLSAVIILQRHTARYPTSSVVRQASRALKKIRRLPGHQDGTGLAEYKAVIASWAAKAGDLTDEGRRVAHQIGKLYRARYADFLADHAVGGLWTRSRGNARCIESAGYLLDGFANRTFELKEEDELPKPDHVFPSNEVHVVNNPLSATTNLGPEFDRYAALGEEKAQKYLDSWLPSVLPHLRRQLGEVPGQALGGTDALALMSLCGFETAQPIYRASGSAIPWSPWCDLYRSLGTDRELELWEGYARWYDVRKYYVKGPGNPESAEAGRQWVDDLKERLNYLGIKLEGNATRNDLSNGSSIARPRLFIDSGSDNRILLTLNALGINLTLEEYSQSRLGPFGAALIVEVYVSSKGKSRLVFRI